MTGLALFAMSASAALGQRVAQALDIPLATHEERSFEDGEHKSRPTENVRDRDVYVIQSLHGLGEQGVNEKLVRLLFFIAALKQSGAGRVTAVVPYLAYSRKDRRTKPYDPVTSRYVASLFEAVGSDRVLTLDVHNLAAFQNAFRCEVEQLEARHLFAERIATQVTGEAITVLSPDTGGVKRAERFRMLLERRTGGTVGSGFMEKYRSAGKLSGERLVGEVAGQSVVIVDDLIAGGSTVARAAAACKAGGAGRILVAASHGVFAPRAGEVLGAAPVYRFYITDSVPMARFESSLQDRFEVIGIAPLLAVAIRRLHGGGSLVDFSEV